MTPEKSAAQGERVIRISYHRRMYGLGEVRLFSHCHIGWRANKLALQ
jgi:hypothetical protein